MNLSLVPSSLQSSVSCVLRVRVLCGVCVFCVPHICVSYAYLCTCYYVLVYSKIVCVVLGMLVRFFKHARDAHRAESPL